MFIHSHLNQKSILFLQSIYQLLMLLNANADTLWHWCIFFTDRTDDLMVMRIHFKCLLIFAVLHDRIMKPGVQINILGSAIGQFRNHPDLFIDAAQFLNNFLVDFIQCSFI